MLRSTFAAFTTAQLAMQASQKALDVTGQNIANVNTDGYTRQRLDTVSLYNQNGSIYNSQGNANVGFGVAVTGVSQVRDPYLDLQYRAQVAKVGYADAKQDVLDSINNTLDETNSDGVKTALNDLSSALTDLSNPTNVGSQVFDSSVRSASQILVNYFHQYSSDLGDIQNELVSNMNDTDVPTVNDLLSSIANLNQTITNSQVLGNSALELIDQRNSKLDDLASYFPIDVSYTSQDYGGKSIESVNVTLRDTDGNQYSLISGNQYGSVSLDTSDSPATFQVTDVSGTTSSDLADKLSAGTFKGSLEMLNADGSFSGDTTRGVGYYQTALDTMASTLAETFNTLNTSSDGTNSPLFTTSDGSSTFTASNIQVSEDWIKGNTKIITSAKADAGSTANDNVLSMISALSSSRSFTSSDGVTFFKGSFAECYNNIETNMGIDSQSNQALLDNYTSVATQISDSKDAVSAVSLDEEGIDLLQYQQSYTAAARLMTTLNDVLDTLINQMM